MAVKHSDRSIYQFIEKVLDHNKMIKPVKNKVAFKPKDMVNCSYIKGLFKIVTLEDNYVVVKSIDNQQIHYVSSSFLEKVELNEQVLKVLYNE